MKDTNTFLSPMGVPLVTRKINLPEPLALEPVDEKHETRINTWLKTQLLMDLESHLKEKPYKQSRPSWIAQAIQEKMERDRKGFDVNSYLDGGLK